MSRPNVALASSRQSEDQPAGSRLYSEPQWRQFTFITLAALAVFVGLRFLPTGTNLNHMDFRVDAKNGIEFCDPSNPQFIPVVAVRSPVVMNLSTAEPTVVGRETRAVVELRTASGKPLGPSDLVVAHTRKLHLLIIDPTLQDYQHVHPEPQKESGKWSFNFTPRAPGAYRIFADFTPAATGRGLYASADLSVAASESRLSAVIAMPDGERPHYQYTLEPDAKPIRAGQPIDLKFAIRHKSGAPVPLEPVMGAFAHLVAFDETRSGFAHLHPAETNLGSPPDPVKPVLTFKLTIPRAGRYVIWAQINLAGREEFVPFAIDVT